MDTVLEKHIQASILDYLSLKRVFHWRNNSGALKTEKGGFVRFGAPGSPDIIAVKDGRVYGIEVKRKTGKLSDHQVVFKLQFERAGGIYRIARSIDDISDIF